MAQATRHVLHGGQSAGDEYLEGRRGPLEAFQPAGVDLDIDEARVFQQVRQPLAVGLDAVEARGCQCPGEIAARLLAGRCVHHHLGQHRVEPGGDLEAGLDGVIHPQLAVVGEGGGHGVIGELHLGEQTAGRAEIVLRILGIDTCLHGVAAGSQRRDQLAQIAQLTGAQLEHPGDDVHAPHQLRDTVLDLQACIDLQEIEGLTLGVIDEFDGTGAAVIDGFAQADGGGDHLFANALGQVRCRAFLDDLLMAALTGAVALAQRDHRAFAVTEQLHFQVTGAGDVRLEEDATITEVALA